jgi:hypothetical protein
MPVAQTPDQQPDANYAYQLRLDCGDSQEKAGQNKISPGYCGERPRQQRANKQRQLLELDSLHSGESADDKDDPNGKTGG